MVTKLPFLSVEMHIAVAGLVARSSQMEHSIESAISGLFGLRKSSAEYVLKNISGAERKLGLLRVLLLEEMPQKSKSVEVFTREIQQKFTFRNKVIHSIWGKSDRNDLDFFGKLLPFKKKYTEYVAADDVEKIAKDMLRLGGILEYWVKIISLKHTKPILEEITRIAESNQKPRKPGGLLG